MKPEHKQQVIESYGRLLKVLDAEVARIKEFGAKLVPEIDFAEVLENGKHTNSCLVPAGQFEARANQTT